MNKKILTSLIFIGLLSLGLGWGTYSQFSDIERSEGNVFTAGTLDLELEGYGDPVSIPMEFKNIAPGDDTNGPDGLFGTADDEQVIIRLDNKGTIDGKVSLCIRNLVNNENDCVEPEAYDPINPDVTCAADEGELGANLLITISYVYYDGVTHGGVWVGEEEGKPYLWRGTLDELAGLGCLTHEDMYLLWENPDTPEPEGGAYLTIAWAVPEDVGNIIQSDSVVFDMEFLLEQV